MSWKWTEPMSERRLFIIDHQRGLFSMAALCAQYGVSRKTGYKWVRRFQRGGFEARAILPAHPTISPVRLTTSFGISSLIFERSIRPGDLGKSAISSKRTGPKRIGRPPARSATSSSVLDSCTRGKEGGALAIRESRPES